MASTKYAARGAGKSRPAPDNKTGADDALTGDNSRGTNQTGVRLYNERLILSLIRRNISLSKIDITHFTGLSAQTVSGIVNNLEKTVYCCVKRRCAGAWASLLCRFASIRRGRFLLA